jgi:hypothetical protein
MPKKRDIGLEILQGLREFKRGEFGRVINVLDTAVKKKKEKGSRRVSGHQKTPRRKR